MVRRETEFGVFHDGRASLAYATVLLREGGDAGIERAARIIRNVAGMQETHEGDAHCGNFRWFHEDEGVTDLNAVEFVIDHLNAIIRLDAELRLPPDAREALRSMMSLGLREIDRLDVHPSYTNIFLSDVCNSVLGGEALDDPAYVERGAQRLREWFDFTNASGAPHEFNSPTYAAVDIARMATLAACTPKNPEIALRARVAEERLWLHTATHYHPELAQIAGPHSRSYRDGWTGASGYLKLMLWRLLGDDALRRQTPYFPNGREEGHTGIALDELGCPPYVMQMMRDKRYPYETVETTDAARELDITTHMTEDYALGTASRSYGVGEPPEPWPAWNSILLHFKRDEAPGYGTLFARYVVNDKGPGAVMYESTRVAEDFWEEGRHVGAQHRNRAIVAYGLQPRTRPARSFKLSVQILGASDRTQVWCGDLIAGERYPRELTAGEPIVIAEGGAYIALIPLEPSDMAHGAPIVLDRTEQGLRLDIYNYRGPAKTFWEHRSQAGPFYKGNVRNAFILEVASRGEYADADRFRRHIAGARISDSVDEEYVREIAYASDGGSIAMRYSLWDMELLERRFDGATFVPPMGRAGALDGSGMQWLQSRDSMIDLAGTKLLAGRAPKWLAADADAGRYVFVNPSDEEVPLWLETPRTVIECDAFGFGRVELDEGEGVVSVDALGEIGTLRLRGSDGLRLLINGTDATPALQPPDADGVRVFLGWQ